MVNDQDIFPSLRHTYLKVFANRMGAEYNFIEKITLHHAPFHTYQGNYRPISYLVYFHIPVDPTGEDEDLYARFRVFKGWLEAPNIPREVSGLPVELWGNDSFFVDVYQAHAKGGRDEWEFRAISEIPHEWIEECWVLFDRMSQDDPTKVGIKENAEDTTSLSPSVPDSPTICIEKHEQNTLCEDIVRSLKFYVGNEGEVKIQEPGKKPKTFNYESLGFYSLTDEWRWFITVIEGPEHFYNYGPARKGHERIKEYERNRSRLKQIDKKLIGFLKKEYHLDPPERFKTFEKAPEEGSGVYKFKFQIENKIDKSKYSEYTDKDLLDEIMKLNKRMNRISHRNEPSSETSYAAIFDPLSAAATHAKARGLINNKDMLDILNEDKVWTPQKEVYDPFENSPDSNSFH